MSFSGASSVFRVQIFPYSDKPLDLFASLPQSNTNPILNSSYNVQTQSISNNTLLGGSSSLNNGNTTLSSQDRQERKPHSFRETISNAIHHATGISSAHQTPSNDSANSINVTTNNLNNINTQTSSGLLNNSTPSISTTNGRLSHAEYVERQQWLADQQNQFLHKQFPQQQFTFHPVEIDLSPGDIIRLGRKVDRHHNAPPSMTPIMPVFTVKDGDASLLSNTSCNCYFHKNILPKSLMNNNIPKSIIAGSPVQYIDDTTPITSIIDSPDVSTNNKGFQKPINSFPIPERPIPNQIYPQKSVTFSPNVGDTEENKHSNTVTSINNKTKKKTNVAWGKEIADLDLNKGAANVLYSASALSTISGGQINCECGSKNISNNNESCECCWSAARPLCCSTIKHLIEPCKDNKIRRSINYIAFKSKVVSRIHAEFWVGYDGILYIKDTGSSSGTFVNRLRLSPANEESHLYQINSGDVIQFGVDYQNRTEEIYKCVMVKVFFGLTPTKSKPINSVLMKQAIALMIAAMNPNIDHELYLATARDSITSLSKLEKTKSFKDLGADTDCAICLCELLPQQSLFVAPCSHCFHFKCIIPLFTPGHMFLCPLCRQISNLDANVGDNLEFNGLLPTDELLALSEAIPKDLNKETIKDICITKEKIENSDEKEDERKDETDVFTITRNGSFDIECLNCKSKRNINVGVSSDNDFITPSKSVSRVPSFTKDVIIQPYNNYCSQQGDRRSIHSITSYVGKVTAKEDLEERMSIKSSQPTESIRKSFYNEDDDNSNSDSVEYESDKEGSTSFTASSLEPDQPLITPKISTSINSSNNNSIENLTLNDNSELQDRDISDDNGRRRIMLKRGTTRVNRKPV